MMTFMVDAVAAQTPEADPMLTTAYQAVTLRAGPGETYSSAGRLNPGVEARIVERNAVGTWVRLRREADGAVVQDGWTLSGYLNLSSELHFSDVPINSELDDADPSTVDSRSMARLYGVPVVPTLSETMVEVFAQGQELGNRANSVTKIGDSLSANPMYIEPMGREAELGAYDYLAETLAYYGETAGQPSAAARIGLTSYVIFDPFWADKEICQPGETPLDCELRLKQPSVALVMFGSNDVKHMTDEEFGEQMHLLVEQLLAKGVIPVLFTFSYHPEADLWPQSLNFNLRLVEVAGEYDVPLVNLWAAARVLPDYGLDDDRVHLKNSGFDYLKFTNGNEVFYGVTLQNLLALRALDEIRRGLGLAE